MVFASEHFEKRLSIPEGFGEGDVKYFNIRDGLRMFFINHKTGDFKTVGKSETPSGLLQLIFYLSGKNMISEMDGVRGKLISNTGDSYILNPNQEGVWELPKNHHLQAVTVSINLSLLNLFIEEDGDLMPPGLLNVLEGSGKPYCQQDQLNPSIQIVLNQMINCPFQGMVKRVYLEGKIFELIALRLEQLYPSGNKCPYSLKSSDLERIHHAKDILIQSMENPPTLTELARQVSLNSRKLKEGFREVFNTTVFGYLRKQRMEQARLLLEDGETSVTQVVYKVGYNNLSHFALAFKKEFGILPGAYLKHCNQSHLIEKDEC